MIQSTNNDLFAFPYSLIRTNPLSLEDYDGTGAHIIFQCHFPEEMLFHFTAIDNFENNKGCYYLFDVANMQLINCYKNKAERVLKNNKGNIKK